jgi:hypothetical protein
LKSQLLPDLKLNSAMKELKNDRDSKQKELKHTQQLVEEAMAAQKIADFNRSGEDNAQVKVHEAKSFLRLGRSPNLKQKWKS